MPSPSSSFSAVTPLPPRVVSVHNAIFEAPDETGPSVAVPTDYKLFTASITPNISVGDNGDWYIWVLPSAINTYRKVINSWTLVSNIAGGGGGGGDISGVNISDCIIDDCTVTNTTLVSCVLTTPIVTSGTFTTPTITLPVVTGGVITGATITGLSTPVGPTDAATKQYVDGVAQGLQIHEQVRGATTGSNISLTGGAPGTLDGLTLVANDRILVKDQTNPVQNGIYRISVLGSGANGTWVRAADAASGHDLDSAYTLVTNGTANGGTSWVVSGAPLIGTDAVNWTRFFAVTSIPASIITGTIVAGQIGSVSAGTIIGTISAGQIGSITAGQITGTISAAQIGSVSAGTIIGTITAGQISSVSATVISGSITASQIGSINANTIVGVITTNQLVDQILNTQRLIANDLSIVRRLASLPSLPNSDYPVGSLVLNTTNKTLYQNVSGAWQVVTASSNVVGTLTANDIASINANSIVGLIIASQISSVSAASITGTITASQIGSVNASVIAGLITAAQISTVNATSIQGSITSTQIASVSASTITGSITAGQIASVNATTITLGSLSAINYTIGSGSTQTTITSSGLSVGFMTISGATNQNTIDIGSALTFPAQLTAGNAGAIFRLGSAVASGSVIISAQNTNQITVVGYGIVGRNGSGRFALEALGGNSISFTTSSIERFFVGSDGHFKSNGGYLMKATSDTWGPKMYDGAHTIEFKWDGGLQVRIDGASVFDVTIT